VWGVLGLGNPGARYLGTRHNVGFLVVDALATRCDAVFQRHEGYWSASATRAGAALVLVKPTTYVNRSGSAARAVLARHGLEPAQLLVVVDDVYLPFGRLRLRPGGSAGGHNGLASIETVLQTRDYPRLRIGVGAPEGADLVDHVLGEWSAAEEEALPATIERAADAVEAVLELGVEAARPRVNATPPG
jgi:peptidyl-tRNA hydrolase, PTH1 family